MNSTGVPYLWCFFPLRCPNVQFAVVVHHSSELAHFPEPDSGWRPVPTSFMDDYLKLLPVAMVMSS
jgi:hypothetical protein